MFLCLWYKAVYGKSSSFSKIWPIKRNLYSVEVKKYKILCITIYVKSKQNGHSYTKFSECVVRKVRQGEQ